MPRLGLWSEAGVEVWDGNDDYCTKGDDLEPAKNGEMRSEEVSDEDVPLTNLEDGLRLLEEEPCKENVDVLQDLP